MPIDFDIDGVLTSREEIGNNLFVLKFDISKSLDWFPGQFLKVRFYDSEGNKLSKPYSILDCKDMQLSLMISTKPGGVASQTFFELKVGDKLQFHGPCGRFTNSQKEGKKVYVATGSGVTPLISMMKQSVANGEKIDLLYGVRSESEEVIKDVLDRYIDGWQDSIDLKVCVSDTSKDSDNYPGRVTDALHNLADASKQYYLCGNPWMVDDTERLLLDNGLDKDSIILERYGRAK